MPSRATLRTMDDFRIAAVYTETTVHDVVIWMHGIAVNKDEYLNFFHDGSDYLAAEGIGSIRFDFRGHGDSSGKPRDFSLVGQNLDAEAVSAFARKHYGDAPATRFHLVAASFGAPRTRNRIVSP